MGQRLSLRRYSLPQDLQRGIGGQENWLGAGRSVKDRIKSDAFLHTNHHFLWPLFLLLRPFENFLLGEWGAHDVG